MYHTQHKMHSWVPENYMFIPDCDVHFMSFHHEITHLNWESHSDLGTILVLGICDKPDLVSRLVYQTVV